MDFREHPALMSVRVCSAELRCARRNNRRAGGWRGGGWVPAGRKGTGARSADGRPAVSFQRSADGDRLQARCLRYGRPQILLMQARRLRYGRPQILLLQARCLRYGLAQLLLRQARCLRYGLAAWPISICDCCRPPASRRLFGGCGRSNFHGRGGPVHGLTSPPTTPFFLGGGTRGHYARG